MACEGALSQVSKSYKSYKLFGIAISKLKTLTGFDLQFTKVSSHFYELVLFKQMSRLKRKIRDCAARDAGGTILLVFGLLMPSYLVFIKKLTGFNSKYE
jgi:hypothetical protein